MTAMIESIKSLRVPVLESGAALLLLELSGPDANLGKVVQLVEMSPAIAAKLVSCANSPWSNPVSPITTIADACARLGLNVVRTTTIALTIGQSFDPNRCPSFDKQQFWCTSIIASNIAAELASAAAVEPGLARTAALLQNIGLLWLAHALPAELDASLVCAAGSPERSLGQCLQARCGTTRQRATLYLFKAWSMPEALQRGLESEGGSALADTLKLAETLANEIFHETPVSESSCPDVGAVHAIYERHYKGLQATRDLAATLF